MTTMNRFATDVKLIRKSRKEKKMNVLEIKGNVNTALCYAKVVEDEAIEQIKGFIRERGEWLDEYIEVLRQYSHESKNKKFNH